MIRGGSRLIVPVLGVALALAPGMLCAQSGGSGETPSRFNGDPYADLAIGAPVASVGAVQAGAVNVLHGSSPDGLTASQSQLWDQSVLVSDNPEAQDSFGYSLAVADFDGDGYLDLAVGAPSEDIGTAVSAGAVHAIYGSPAGLSVAGNQFWTQGDLGGVPDSDLFGWALAAGDFNGDGFDDLAIGAPFENPGGVDDAGMVQVVYGSSGGLTAAGTQVWTQDTAGVAGIAEADDLFGDTLAVGDFNADGYADLAIGVSAEDYALTDDGVVHVLYGSNTGLTAEGDDLWYTEAMGAVARAYDHFGGAVVSGDFNGDAHGDLVVSAPGGAAGTVLDAGVVYVIFGSDSGLIATGAETWSQDTAGGGETSEDGDRFGGALAAGDLDGDRYDDLAIGVPDEDLAAFDAGCINVLYGSAIGLVAPGQVWHQDSPGIIDSPEAGDQFGRALAVGDFDGDGRNDLAVGVPNEILEYFDDSHGAVHVLYGSQNGLSATDSQIWHQEVVGVPGEGGGLFGASLASLPISGFLFGDGFESGDTSAWSATVP